MADGKPDKTIRDLGMSTTLSDGKTLWAFGDSFEPSPGQSGVHPSTAAIASPTAPGTMGPMVEAKDANGHRSTFVPLDVQESAFNNGQRYVPVTPQRVADTRDNTAPGYPAFRPVGPQPSGADKPFKIDFNNDNTPIMTTLAGADSVMLQVTVFNPVGGSSTDVKVTQEAETPFSTSKLMTVGGGEQATNITPAVIGWARHVWITHSAGAVDIAVDVIGYYSNTAGSYFTPTAPTMVWNSMCASGATITVQVTGSGACQVNPVPTGATAVVLSTTAQGPASVNTVQLWKGGQSQPTAPGATPAIRNMANITMPKDQIRGTTAVVPLSPTGQVTLGTAGTNLVKLDVIGYYAPAKADEFIALEGITVCDTARTGTSCASGPVRAGTPRTFKLPTTQVPAGVGSVMLNVTTKRPALGAGVQNSRLSVGNGTEYLPALYSNATSTRSSVTVTKVSATGTITVANEFGDVDVVVDVIGFTASRGAIVADGECVAGIRPRIAHWPTSMVNIPQRDANNVMADRVIIHYVDLFVCTVKVGTGTGVGYPRRHMGLAEFWYRTGRPATEPIIATRLTSNIDNFFPSKPDPSTQPYGFGVGGITANGFLYVYGCATAGSLPVARKGCSLARTPLPTTFNDVGFASHTSYKYFTNTLTWATSIGQAVPVKFETSGDIVLELPGAGMSVEFIPSWGPNGMYVMAYEGFWQNRTAVIRTAPALSGPWSEAVNGTAKVSINDCQGTKGCYTMRVNKSTTTSSQLGLTYYNGDTSKMMQSALPVQQLPGQVRNLVATPGPGAVNASWAEPVNVGSPRLTTYNVTLMRWTLSGSTVVSTVSSTTRSVNFMNLGANNSYYVVVVAKNALGTGPAVNSSVVTTGTI